MLSHMMSLRHAHTSRSANRVPRMLYGIPAAAGIAVACAGLVTSAFAQSAPDAEALIADALRAAPAGILETATVSDLEGNILREGTSDYTCFPAPSGIAGPMCMDAEWRRWMAAWMGGTPFTAERVAVAYMLAGDEPDGGASNIDPAASEPTAENEWVVEGPHIMIITPDPSAFEGLPTVIQTDGPYVMWTGTPYVHLMVPVEARPEQRAVLTQ
ncbi:hypothetical protein SAMN05444004_11721 [Jannaschia faecimaris]|uniref:Uncharacterized protein n=1 Tax=Jannaschia faecimaris TaxID=1244108 RepID=A0A1H3TIQ3_9RHOB|nr:hypothetical protein [Jannaschia faecimaris]SDZ49535.1 hypothetical protein SAMN05444004_11721 [Jannaschia faecimaris]